MNEAAVKGFRAVAAAMRANGTKVVRVATTYHPFAEYEVRYADGTRVRCATCAGAEELATLGGSK